MKKNELIDLLQRQNDFLQGKLDEALAAVSSLTLANEKLTATFIGTCDVVRYEMLPMRFIKKIYKVKKYVQGEKVFKGTAPAAPLLNSQYTSSFISGLAELRYLHGMPLENVVEYFRTHDFDLDKGTAQKLVSKVKVQLENLYKALGKAILDDGYVCGDETYQKVRLQVATSSGKKSRKDIYGCLSE